MKEQNTLEIDVLQLSRALWKRKLVILLVAIITSSVAFAYSTFVIKPEFTSTTRIYVVNRDQGEKSGLTNQDLQAGSYLVKDYREIILSQDVLEEVVSDLKLDLTPKGLANKIKVTVPVDTRIVSVSVNDRVPEEARSILENEIFYPCYYPTNRNLKNLIKNTILAFKILRKERPDIIVSSGRSFLLSRENIWC